MHFQATVPVILCHNIEATLEFYQQAFRYILIDKTITQQGMVWAYLKSDNCYLMLKKSEHSNPKQVTENDSVMLYYYTDDVEAQHRFMTAKGFPVSPLHASDYNMKEFFLVDPEGNKLGIGQKASD